MMRTITFHETNNPNTLRIAFDGDSIGTITSHADGPDAAGRTAEWVTVKVWSDRQHRIAPQEPDPQLDAVCSTVDEAKALVVAEFGS